MAYVEVVVPERFADQEAEFRTYVGAIHDALVGAGLTQTADTGQIDPATVVMPVANTLAGYEIWRFNDAGQAANPIFFRLEYWTGGALGRHQLKLTIGTGSNGAGVIANPDSQRTFAPNFTPTTGTGLIVCSYFDGALFFYDYAESAFSIMFGIERLRNIGDNAFNGWIVFWGDVASGQMWSNAGNRVRSNLGTWIAAVTEYMDYARPGASVDNELVLGVARLGNKPSKHIRGFIGLPTSVASGDSGSVDDGSTVMTYKRLPMAQTHNPGLSTGVTAHHLGVRTA